MSPTGIEEKVAFLSKPEAYPGCASRVDIKQTHMSWVFLTETQAWKLKKPVRNEYVDFSTPEGRRRNCEREIRLNRRLAPDVYRGVVPLTASRDGNFELGGRGEPVDWLVCMRRLPPDRMLDQVISRRAVSAEDVFSLASVLAEFYGKARQIRITGLQYRTRLSANLEAIRTELAKAEYELPTNLVHSKVDSQLKVLRQNGALFDGRAAAGKIVEAHGDLRPEHVCLERRPVIIDCLEFNWNLRVLDAASDLAFLALECDRLGVPETGAFILKTYAARSGDRPSHPLIEFYKSYHACTRAKVAVRHLKDESIRDRARWKEKAIRYLETAGTATAAA